MLKKISVIIPIYNKADYLDECIFSVVNQTYKTLEILLVNDGSTDNSLDICKKWALTDNRIVVISQNNKGVSVARNEGLNRSSGDYIAFVDADDCLSCDYISVLVSLCERNKCDISQVGYCYIDDKTSIMNVETNEKEEKMSFYSLFSSQKRVYRALVCAKLFSKHLFNDYRFPERRIFEDEEASFYLCYKAKYIALSNKKLYLYRMTDNSIMRNNKNSINTDFIFLHNGIISFLEELGDDKTLNIERKELCIRLIMNYIPYNNKKIRKIDKVMLLKEYKKNFKNINDYTDVSRKEKYALILFYFFPNIFSFFESRICLIKKIKVKRVLQS